MDAPFVRRERPCRPSRKSIVSVRTPAKRCIEAAVEEFSCKGYEATTVAAIARRAGVTTGAVYAHFRGKLELLLEALGLRTADKFTNLAIDAASGRRATVATRSRSGLVGAPLGRRELLLIDAIAVARRDAGRRESADQMIVAARQEAFERTAQAGVDSGCIDPVLPHDELARLVSGLAFGMMVLRALERAAAERRHRLAAGRTAVAADAGTRARHERPPRPRALRARAAERAQTALRDAVATAAAAGLSLRKLGEAAGLSHERIRVMLAEHESPS